MTGETMQNLYIKLKFFASEQRSVSLPPPHNLSVFHNAYKTVAFAVMYSAKVNQNI